MLADCADVARRTALRRDKLAVQAHIQTLHSTFASRITHHLQEQLSPIMDDYSKELIQKAFQHDNDLRARTLNASSMQLWSQTTALVQILTAWQDNFKMAFLSS